MKSKSLHVLCEKVGKNEKNGINYRYMAPFVQNVMYNIKTKNAVVKPDNINNLLKM